jgi:hypothetical protein
LLDGGEVGGVEHDIDVTPNDADSGATGTSFSGVTPPALRWRQAGLTRVALGRETLGRVVQAFEVMRAKALR